MPDRFPDRAISFASPFPAQNGASNEVKNSQAPVAERPLQHVPTAMNRDFPRHAGGASLSHRFAGGLANAWTVSW